MTLRETFCPASNAGAIRKSSGEHEPCAETRDADVITTEMMAATWAKNRDDMI